MAEATLESTLVLSGPLTLATLGEVRARLGRAASDATVDITKITRLDTAGAWLLSSTGRRVDGGDEAQRLLIRAVQHAMPHAHVVEAREPRHSAGDVLAGLGEAVVDGLEVAARSLGFFGQVMARLAATLRHPRRLRLTALVHHMQEVGLNAVPIVALMGFLIGVVLAFQGAAQLRQFGAEVFVVDLIAVSILRELGIL